MPQKYAKRCVGRWRTNPDLVGVGEAGTGAEGLTNATALSPDVVILDIELPRLDGYAVTRALKASAYPPIIVFLTIHSDVQSRRRAAEAGSDGFAQKGAGWPALNAEVHRGLRVQSTRDPS
jgi:DNA-binding NarL/FixJ family response regulator